MLHRGRGVHVVDGVPEDFAVGGFWRPPTQMHGTWRGGVDLQVLRSARNMLLGLSGNGEDVGGDTRTVRTDWYHAKMVNFARPKASNVDFLQFRSGRVLVAFPVKHDEIQSIVGLT